MGPKLSTTISSENDGKKDKLSASSNNTTVFTSTNVKENICQNFRLFWLDANIDESNDDFRNSLYHLNRIVNLINTYTDADKCVKELEQTQNAKVFLIVSGFLGQKILPEIHDKKSQLDAVFIFCSNKAIHEEWALKWKKVRGVFTDIESICHELRSAVLQCDENSVSISFLSTSSTSANILNRLDQSFMCIQLFKENILQTDDDPKVAKEDFVKYCKARKINTSKIKKFNKNYDPSEAVDWYSSEPFLSSMLNWALYTLSVDTILKMGFFIRDLHQCIKDRHKKAYDNYKECFYVYRGQGLSIADFEKLKQNGGNLMSFNNFLPTSKNKDECLNFARAETLNDVNTVGIVFVMIIDPRLSTNPFVVGWRSKQEILFSFYSVFRIGNIQQIEENDRFWEVQLTLIDDDDRQLADATKLMRDETSGLTGWDRLSELLFKFGEFDKAKEVYNVLLSRETTNDINKAFHYQQLGRIERQQGKYDDAIKSYKNAHEIRAKIHPANHPSLADSYNNIGLVYENMRDYETALSYHKQALEIREKALSSDNPTLATSYNNIGNVYNELGNHTEAVLFHKKALEIREKVLPSNHPNLANSYNNIGLVYFNKQDYSNALNNHKKALEIREKAQPPNYSSLAGSYNNIALVYESMADYSNARSNYEKAIATGQRSLSSNHPHLLMYKTNYARVMEKL